ncbi:MAG: hypothetical protein V3T42_00765 [Nitrospirales bacterium]
MNGPDSSEEDASTPSRTPLVSMGVIIIVVLMVPILLYSVGPEGPIKVGDVVFATARYRVQLVGPDAVQQEGNEEFCILEPRTKLVVQNIGMNSSSSMIAEAIGLDKPQTPFCFPRTPVLLHPHQVTLKADLWRGLRDTVRHFFSEN